MDATDWIALGAAVVALAALFVSIAAYRQKSRFHPQPKLQITWRDRIEPDKSGLLFRQATVTNHGDAPARDLKFYVSTATTADGSPWYSETILEPTQHRSFRVPVVDRVVKTEDVMYVHYDRTGDPGDYKMLTPTLRFTWRQPPFSGRPFKDKSKAPHTPNVLSGETS